MKLALLALGLLAPPAWLAAQSNVVVGDRVRVYAPTRVEGVVVSRDTLSLTMSIDGRANPLVVRVDSLTSLQVRRGHHASVGKGALVGAGVGFGAGFIAGLAMGDDPGGIISFTAPQKGLILGIALGGAGAVLGTLVGLGLNTAHWEEVPISGGRLSAIPGVSPAGGANLTLRMSFSF
jgi:hypothetical protein